MNKVCHITTVHQSRYDVRIFKKECSSLASARYDVTLLVNDELPDEKLDGVSIISLGATARGRIERATKVTRAAYKKALEVDADIYHLHDPELLPMGWKLKKQGKKVIFDSHEFTAVQIRYKPYIPKIFRGVVSEIYRKYESHILKNYDGIVVPCTRRGSDYFAAVDIPKVIIGNYPKMDEIEEIKRDEIDSNKVCYVGGLTEIRGLFHMIKACHLANKKLVLIGSISKELRARMEQMPEYECVEYLGVLPHEIALREVAKCAVGLSLLEPLAQYVDADNLPTKVYEYMMLGMPVVPVVLSDFPYSKKVLDKFKFGISVSPYDHQVVADAIVMLTRSDEMQREMGREGRRAIDEEMNWGMDSIKHISFYREM